MKAHSRLEDAQHAIRQAILAAETSSQDIAELEKILWQLRKIQSHYPTVNELNRL